MKSPLLEIYWIFNLKIRCSIASNLNGRRNNGILATDKKNHKEFSVEPGFNGVKVSYAPGCTWEVATFKNNYKEK